MRNFITKKVRNFFTGMAGFLIAIPLLIAGGVYAATIYPAGSLLQPNDVTSSHIRDNTIVNADISTSAAISPLKLSGGNTGGQLFYANYDTFGTSTALTWATSTSKLSITGSLSASASTTFNGIEYKFPSADGAANQALKTNGAGGLSWGTVSASQVVGSFTAGHTLSAGQSVFIASTTATIIDLFNPNIIGDTEINLGYNSTFARVAQSVTEQNTYIAEYVTITARKVGAPADNLVVAIQNDTAGNPSGTDLATATFAGGTLTTSQATYRAQLTVPVTLTATNKYWIVWRRSGALDTGNYYFISADDTSPTYSNGERWRWDTSLWYNAGPGDHPFSIQASTTIGRIYQTSASDNGTTATFLGITNGAGAQGSSIDVVVSGIATGLSGLTTGIPYYVSNTAGTISTTAGTVSKKVGAALSATTLLIQNTW